MGRRNTARRYGFPVFIVVAIVAGAILLVALNHRTPPAEPAAQPYPAGTSPIIAPPTPSPSASATVPSSAPSRPAAGPTRMSVLGAAATDGNSPDLVGKRLGGTSWVSYAVGSGVDFVGGWADPGVTSQRIAAAARTIPSDVLVIDVGLEDQLRGVPFSQTSTNIATMVRTANAPKVVLLSAAPLESQPGAAGTVNRQLKQLAGERG